MKLNINGASAELDAPADMPLLWALRDVLNLTGTKFGCGIGACRSCTVLVDGAPQQSCTTACGSVGDKAITTIEGLAQGGIPSKLQQAWLDHQVPQCGYCQPGWLMAATALLQANPSPTDDDIDAALRGHICRCGTYNRIRAAIRSVAGEVP